MAARTSLIVEKRIGATDKHRHRLGNDGPWLAMIGIHSKMSMTLPILEFEINQQTSQEISCVSRSLFRLVARAGEPLSVATLKRKM